MSVTIALCCLAAYGFVTISFLAPLFEAMASRFGSLELPLALAFENVVVACSLLFGALFAMSPQVTVVDRLMASMPVSARARQLGYLLPLFGVSLAALAVLYSPVIIAVLGSPGVGGWQAVWVALLWAFQVTYALLLVTLFNLVVMAVLTRMLAVPEGLARVSGIVVVGLVLVAAFIADSIRTVRGSQAGASPLGALGTWIDGTGWPGPAWFGVVPGRVAVCLVAVVFLVALGTGVIAVAGLLSRADTTRQRPLFRSVLRPAWPFGMVVITALRLAARHPENRLYAGFYSVIVSAGLGLAWWLEYDLSSGLDVGVLFVVALAAGFPVNAYGRTRAHRWVVAAAPLVRERWLLGNLLGTLIHGGLVAAMLVVPFAVAGWRAEGWGHVGSLVVVFLLSGLWMMAAGTVVPYSNDVPLSSMLSVSVALLTGVPTYYGLSKLGFPGDLARSSAILVLMAIALWLVMLALDARRHASGGL